MDKAAFLARIRDRKPAQAPPNVAHPLRAVDQIPHVAYARALDDPVAAFTDAASNVGTVVRRTSDRDAAIAEVVAEIGATSAVVSRDPETEGVAEALSGLGVRALDPSAPRPGADLGVVGARWGIAATGTVVVDAARAGGRTASLLPPAVVVLLPAGAILPDSGELFRQMPARFGEHLPSQFALLTGPSRSADIELEITIGVHGPGRVWVLIV